MKKILLIFAFLIGACATTAQPAAPGSAGTLRLATTTSTYDSGLLDAILPNFEAEYDATVEVIAVGTGQALKLGELGDADVLLVHAPAKEIAFIDAGYGVARYPVMFNDFVIVGPAGDPANIAATTIAADALARIAAAQARFASRGDSSGTHTKELALWDAAGIVPDVNAAWYFSLGQGMGATLNFANEKSAYTLTDRATFLAQQASLAGLAILFGGATPAHNPDPQLQNPYSVIPVNPTISPAINAELANAFVDWLRSPATQAQIAVFGIDTYGIPLFFPDVAPED